MKIRTILDENYMALEQEIARSLDEAVNAVQSAGMNMAITLRKYGSIVENVLLYEEPDYINFKHNELVETIVKDYVIQGNIAESVKRIKTNNTFSLVEAATLSYMLNAYILTECEDEVELMSMFFGGKDNIEIPDSESNIFEMVVSEAGIAQGYKSYRYLLEKTQEMIDKYNKGLLEKDLNLVGEAAQHLAMLYESSKILL